MVLLDINNAVNSLISNENVKGVTLKIAFDSSTAGNDYYGGVADASEEKSERFTSPESLDMVHRLRAVSDCVVVGRSTVEYDNCTLTVRRVPLLPGRPQPFRVIIDPQLKTWTDKNKYSIFNDGFKTLLYHCKAPKEGSYNSESTSNTETVYIPPNLGTESSSPRLSMKTVIEDLKNRGIEHIMVEGGPATARSFIEEGLVNRAMIVKAPVKFKDPIPSNISQDMLTKSGLEFLGEYSCGKDTIECWSHNGAPWPLPELQDWPSML